MSYIKAIVDNSNYQVKIVHPLGSLGFTAAARAVWVVSKDRDNQGLQENNKKHPEK